MSYYLIVKEEAQNDIEEAFLYYEEKRKGLGDQFLKAVQIRYEQLAQNSQYYGYVSADKEKTLRRVKIKGFPYLMVYDIIVKEVTVYLVLNSYKNKKDIY